MLEIKNIYKTFNAGTVNEKRALNGLSLNLEDGDFVTAHRWLWRRQLHYAQCHRRCMAGG